MRIDKQIREALEQEANEASVPADLIREKVKRSGGKLRLKSSLWHKLQIGRRIEVAAVFLVLLGLVFGAVMRAADREYRVGDQIMRGGIPVELPVERVLLEHVTGYPPEGGPPEPLTLPRDRETIQTLWLWWLDARPLGVYTPPHIKGMRRPTIVFELQSGERIRITQAVDCVDDRCTVDPRDVVQIGSTDADIIRVRAPELAAWLRSGWTQSIRPKVSTDRVQIRYVDVVQAQVNFMRPDQPWVSLDPVEHENLLEPVLAAWNAADRFWERDIGTTPDFTVEIETSYRLSLQYVESLDYVMASYLGKQLWVRSDELKAALKQVGESVASQR